MKGFHFVTGYSIFLFLFLLIMPSLTQAANDKTAVDLWKTYDLQGKARSILRFHIVNHELEADVVKVLVNNGSICYHCEGKNKNKPYIGMTIIKGLQPRDGQWIGGTVLDTDSGNVYSCNISLSDDGETMLFHAYKGIPLFGRTVKWKRVSSL